MQNHLEHLEEFRHILEGYKISSQSQAILAKTKLVLMLGLSSSGRNSIIKELLKTGEYHFIVSDTTRHKRANDGIMEQDGVEYWFRTEDEFLSDLKDGKYLEAEIIHNQQVSGISIRELQNASQAGKIAITDVDLNGAEGIVEVYAATIPLLILPPSFEEWQNRLNGRGELPKDEVRRRLETATKILNAGLRNEYFIFVVNDDFHESVKTIHNIIKTGVNQAQQKRGREVITALLTATELFLKSN